MYPDPSTYSSQINMNPQFPEHEHLNCPRCESSNTKFCYYNNYNLSQPRHFCKNCRRYWTKGGTLRNIPVGGGTRKITKRSSNPAKRPANSSSPTSPVTPPPPPPLAQPKPEPSGIFGFSINQTEVGGGSFSSFRSPAGSNHGARFGSFLIDGLSTNPTGGSPATDVFRINHLSANNDNNQSKIGAESSCWNGGNGWPNLSIDPPGSDFH